MAGNRKKIFIWVALAAVLLSCVLLWYGDNIYRYESVNYTEVHSNQGVWDLTDIDFSNTVVSVVGDLQHFEGEMLTPEQFEAREHEALLGNPIDHNEGRTVRLKILVPYHEYYRVFITGDYARSLYVNGIHRGAFGQPADNAEDFVAKYGEIEIDTTPKNGVIELVMQGGNFVHREGSYYSGMLIGAPGLVGWFVNYQSAIELISIGLLALLCMVHIMLASYYDTRLLNMTFSAVCFIFAIRIGLVGTKVIYDIFPNIQWELAIKTEYIFIALGVVLISQILSIQFPGATSNVVRKIIFAVSFGFIAVFLVVDTYTMSRMYLVFHFFNIASIFYYMSAIIVDIIKKNRHKEQVLLEQKIAAFSFALLTYTTVSDIFYFYGRPLFGVQASLAEYAILLFALTQTFAVFHATMHTIQKAKEERSYALALAENFESLSRMKTEFLQDMSHEMKTPLTVIGTGTNYAIRRMEKEEIESEALYNTLDIIENEVARLGRMVNGMLKMADISTGENRNKTDLGEMLTRCARSHRLVAENRGNTILCNIPEQLPFVFVDDDSFMRVFDNILSNAIRHTENGTITVTVLCSGSIISVEISDTGIGIPEELLPELTRRGVSGSGGTGFGLHICKTVCEAHGGELTIESSRGVGTRVQITIPVYGGQQEGRVQ